MRLSGRSRRSGEIIHESRNNVYGMRPAHAREPVDARVVVRLCDLTNARLALGRTTRQCVQVRYVVRRLRRPIVC